MTWTATDVPDLTGRRVLVTGAADDVCRAVVTVLAGRGAEVLLAGPDPDALAAVRSSVAGGALRTLALDVADHASVRRAADAVDGPLHLLLGDAGPRGLFALSGLLLPRLVTGGRDGHGDARVVAVVRAGHRLARRVPPGRSREWQAGAGAQLAGLVLALELDRRAREAGLPLRSLAADPGLSGSALTAPRGPGILDAVLSVLGQPADAGALPLLMACTADVPGSSYVGPGGPGGLRGPPRLLDVPRRARDPEAARRLWQLAEAATGVVHPWLGPAPGS